MKQLTLSFLIHENRICLGLKKRGFGEGNWNGFGGKLEEGESIREAAVRELSEESGVLAVSEELLQVAIIHFFFEDGKHLEVHAFFAMEWEGEPVSTEEMEPAWFPFTEIPYDHMWEDDQYWLPRVLLGEKLQGNVWFDETGTHIKKMEWVRVNNFV